MFKRFNSLEIVNCSSGIIYKCRHLFSPLTIIRYKKTCIEDFASELRDNPICFCRNDVTYLAYTIMCYPLRIKVSTGLLSHHHKAIWSYNMYEIYDHGKETVNSLELIYDDVSIDIKLLFYIYFKADASKSEETYKDMFSIR